MPSGSTGYPVAKPEQRFGGNPSAPESIPWWRQAVSYVAAGILLCRRDVRGLALIVGIFVLPALAAVVVGSQPARPAYWTAEALTWITITMGNISVVLAVEALAVDGPLAPRTLLPAAVRWLPRYLWTNAITTALFWGLYLPSRSVLGAVASQWGWPSYVPLALLLLPMIFWHVRLVFATYAAIIDDQPGIRAVATSFRVAHRRWRMVAAVFACSILVQAPLAGPLYLLILRIRNPVVAAGYTWALIMLMRPLIIASLHEIYEDYRPAPAPSGKRRGLLRVGFLRRSEPDVPFAFDHAE